MKKQHFKSFPISITFLVFFKGLYLPQKWDLVPSLEGECKPIQKHDPSYWVEINPSYFVWVVPTLLTRANGCSTARIIVDNVPHYNVGQGLTPRRIAHAAEIVQVFGTLPPNLNVMQLHIDTNDILGKGCDLILLGKCIARAFPKLRAVEWSKARLRSTNVNVTHLWSRWLCPLSIAKASHSPPDSLPKWRTCL